MSSPPKTPELLPTGRTKWVWLSVAGALGLWLLVMLLLARPDDENAGKNGAPQSAGTKPSFDSPAAEAFPNRYPVKASRPLPAFPALPDERKRE